MRLSRICLVLFCLITTSCHYRFFDDIVLPEIELTPEGNFVSKVEPTFASINENIILPKCISCHSPQGSASDLPFNSYEDLVNGIFVNVVVPGDSAASSFYRVIQPDARRRMPPRSSSITPVNAEQILAIQVWIDSGARP